MAQEGDARIRNPFDKRSRFAKHAMTPPPEDDPLSVQAALDAIEQASGFTEPLRRRTEGVTIAWWGLITATIVLSNGILDDVYRFHHAGGWKFLASSMNWLPWAGLGVAGTHAIWRVAELSVRRPEPGLRRSWKVMLLWGLGMIGLVLGLALVVPVAQAGVAIAVVGAIWLTVGELDLYKATPVGRRTLLVVGALILVAGATYGAATASDNALGWRYFTPVATLTVGLIPVVAGLWQSLRG